MGAVRTHNKKTGAKRPSGFPSFVYRQDGYELSYEVVCIILRNGIFVKPGIKFPVEWIDFNFGLCYYL